ncbi:hypothetical protein KVV02_004360, partial [Mortierella alpina]
MMGIDKNLHYNSTVGEVIQHHNVEKGIKACYFPGAGHGGTFLEHLFNGVIGNDPDDDCLKVYKYIVQHYTLRTPPPEIWMFGYSRGAYTVRRVDGMIYNCGIRKWIKNGHPVTKTNNAELSEERDLCKLHDVPTAVKFMGLFDTVGSLGIPYINPDLGLAFHEFHDTRVSSVVEKWMLEAIMKHSGNNLIPDIVKRINDLVTDMTAGVKFEASREDLDDDVIDDIATFRSIAEPLWRLAKFNFHVQDAIVRGARLNKLPFVDSALGVFDDIFNHDPFNNAQNTAKALDV